jgi:hypothetical protein
VLWDDGAAGGRRLVRAADPRVRGAGRVQGLQLLQDEPRVQVDVSPDAQDRDTSVRDA